MTPPKRPTRNRDVFVPKTTQRAESPIPTEDWSGDTGTHSLDRDEDTPVGLETVDAAANMRQRARVKETNTTVKEVKAVAETIAETTNVGVTTIRTEMQGHVTRLEGAITEVKSETAKKFDEVFVKIDGLDTNVRTATTAVVQAVSGLNRFQGVVVENQLEKSKITWDVHANQQKLADKNKADAIKQKRSFWYKVGATVLKILGGTGLVVATAIATHYIERC